MRLGQLSRQIEVKPEKIITYLEKKGIEIKHHPNAKVDDELIAEITQHFTPTEPIAEPPKEVSPQKEIPKKKKDAETNSKPEEKEPEAEPTAPEHIETEKPTDLPGPKIIGKIDLPDKAKINVEVDGVVYDMETLETKKKESLKEERERKIAEKEAKEKAEAEAKEQARIKREEEKARREKQEAERIEKKLREKEKQRAIQLKKEEKQKAELEKRRKEKQKKHYEQQFKPKTKPNNLKKTVDPEPVKKETPNINIEQPKEKNLIKRFIKWLNT